MPLASLAALQWYGPACACMKVTDAVGSLEAATPHKELRPAIAVIGTGTAQTLRPYRGYAAALQADGSGHLHRAAVRQNKKFGLIVDVGATPSAEDIAQAIWNASASKYNNAGTMGSKVNTASSGGVDTGALVDGIVSDSRTLTVGKFLALN